MEQVKVFSKDIYEFVRDLIEDPFRSLKSESSKSLKFYFQVLAAIYGLGVLIQYISYSAQLHMLPWKDSGLLLIHIFNGLAFLIAVYVCFISVPYILKSDVFRESDSKMQMRISYLILDSFVFVCLFYLAAGLLGGLSLTIPVLQFGDFIILFALLSYGLYSSKILVKDRGYLVFAVVIALVFRIMQGIFTPVWSLSI